jgi:hypothetical protein
MRLRRDGGDAMTRQAKSTDLIPWHHTWKGGKLVRVLYVTRAEMARMNAGLPPPPHGTILSDEPVKPDPEPEMPRRLTRGVRKEQESLL